MTKRIWLGILCMLFGICFIALPYTKELLADERQKELLTEWQDAQTSSAAQTATPSTVAEAVTFCEDQTGATQPSASKTASGTSTDTLDDGLVGILKIPAIDLEQPILKDATAEHLNISAATVEPTAAPGEAGNLVIAGHNSRTYGRHFNRLDELKQSDEIIIQTNTGTYVYEIADTYVVHADELWVLEHTLPGAEITLITCRYLETGEKARFIIKGTLKSHT